MIGREDAGYGDAEIWTATAAGTLHAASVKVTAKTSGYTVTVTILSFRHAVATGAIVKATATTGVPRATLKTTHNDAWVVGMADDWAHSIQPKAVSGQIVNSRVADSTDTYWVQAPSLLTTKAGTSVTIADSSPTRDPWNLILAEIY
jgi:hypothetical protein